MKMQLRHLRNVHALRHRSLSDIADQCMASWYLCVVDWGVNIYTEVTSIQLLWQFSLADVRG